MEHRPLQPELPIADRNAAMGFAPARDAAAPPHSKTKGEQKFDRLTYGGIGYVANVLLSLGAVFWVERTPMGQRFMQGLVHKAEKIPNVTPKWAQFIASKTFFLTGGFAVLVPMKILEDHKVNLVRRWDRQIYGPQADTDPQLQQSHAQLEAAPKQSWASIMGSRVLSLIPFYGLMMFGWSHKSPLAKITNPEYRGLDKAGKQALMALEETNFSAFSKTMQHGFYPDRLIAGVSRPIGKALASVTGNKATVEAIRTMEEKYPGIMKEGSLLVKGPIEKTERDPHIVAWPYYFISELITSAIVARAVYLMTRVLGPLIGIKDPKAAAPHTVAHGTLPRAEHPPAALDDTQPHPTVNSVEYQSRATAMPAELAR